MDKGESTAEDIEKLKKMVPKAYQKYIESKKKKIASKKKNQIIFSFSSQCTATDI